jgi:hypothetical protein
MRVAPGIVGGLVLAIMVVCAPPARSLDKVPEAPPSPPGQTPIPAAANADQCGAADLAGLVGKPRSEIPVPIDPTRRRVYCTTCMVTQDYDPARLNIVFDAQTGLIKQVKCG